MGIVNKYKVVCQVGRVFISYHKGVLYRQSEINGAYQAICRLPVHGAKYYLQKIRIIERLLRLEPRVAIATSSTTLLVSYQGFIYNINVETGNIVLEHTLRDGMNNPLSFCSNGKDVLYGEYFTNDGHEEVSVFRRNSDKWDKVFSFAPGVILHIHQIVFDKYRNCYWIQTGDSDSESGIWKADLDFKSVVPMFCGNQQFRSCFLAPLSTGLVYATDTPLETNHLYMIKENKDGTWEDAKILQEIPGPCIYGKTIKDETIAIATSVEPDPTLPLLRYRVSYKLGKGVKDRYSHILVGNPEFGLKEVYKGKKDWMPMNLFQFGNYQFPSIEKKSILYATGQSICGEDCRTISIEI